MRLLFVHDHKFKRVNKKLYSPGWFNDEILNRYTRYCDEVVVVARVIDETKADERWSLITNQKVTILGTDNFNYSDLEKEIGKCDKLIVRLPSFMGLKALKINNRIGKPYLIEMVGCAWDSVWNHSIKGKIIAPYIFLKNKREVYKAPYVLYVTDEFLQKRYPTKGKQVGCSDVCLVELKDDVLEKRIRRIELNNDKIIIGTIAGLEVKYKGQQYIIEALGEMKKQGITNYEYHLVGNGKNDYLKSVAQKNNVESQVIFVGGLPHEKIFEWLDNIDIYAQPSKQEGLPRAVVEAMSRALPILGAKTGGIPELIQGEYIFAHSKCNSKSIINILKKFNKISMMNVARYNFEKAKKYHANKLEDIRNGFYKDFFDSL